jgi:hypothetical protein
MNELVDQRGNGKLAFGRVLERERGLQIPPVRIRHDRILRGARRNER